MGFLVVGHVSLILWPDVILLFLPLVDKTVVDTETGVN